MSNKKDNTVEPAKLSKLEQLAICRAQSEMMYKAVMDTVMSRRLSKKGTYHKTPLKQKDLRLVNPETAVVSHTPMKYVGEAMLEIFRMSQHAVTLIKM